jgi:hypothetical protein
MSPPSSGSKNNQARNRHNAVSSFCYLLHTSFLLNLFFDPEDGGDMFLRNASLVSADYAALYFTRQTSSNTNRMCCIRAHSVALNKQLFRIITKFIIWFPRCLNWGYTSFDFIIKTETYSVHAYLVRFSFLKMIHHFHLLGVVYPFWVPGILRVNGVVWNSFSSYVAFLNGSKNASLSQ